MFSGPVRQNRFQLPHRPQRGPGPQRRHRGRRVHQALHGAEGRADPVALVARVLASALELQYLSLW